MTSRRVAPAYLLFVLSLGMPVAAQDDFPEPKTAEQYAEEAREAEASPLFASDEPLAVRLLTDIDWIRDTRNDSIEVDGTMWFPGDNGEVLETPLEVRARGEFRRSSRNCNFPPLRLDFPRGDMDGTVFEGQNRLKLVTPCQDGRDNYQEYVLKEYLVYKTQAILTPLANRVRLFEITYEDIEDNYDTRTKLAFVIESDQQMSARIGGALQDVNQLHPSLVNGDHAVMVSMFQYLVGNSDWSPTYFHNVKLVVHPEGRYLTIPYDFDFAGAVDARYADPPEGYPIRSVTDRYFASYCRPELEFESLAALFNSKKAEIIALYEGFGLLEEDARNDVLEFYEEFWEMMEDEGEFEDEILDNCRNW